MSNFSPTLKCEIIGLLSLSRLSAIQVGKQLCTQPEWKRLLISCIKKNVRTEPIIIESHLEEMFCTHVTGEIRELILPERVKKELRFIVASMALRLWQWVMKRHRYIGMKGYMIFHSVDMAHYIDHIHWTHYGSIDEAGTVRSMYYSNVFPKNIETWRELCRYSVEDCINDLWPKLSERENYKPIEPVNIISAYWSGRMLNCLERTLGFLKIYMQNRADEELSLEENMCEYSFLLRYNPSVEYFWTLLNTAQRKRIIRRAAEDLIFSGRYFEHQPDTMHFVLKQLVLYEMDDLLMKVLCCNLVLIEFVQWPYQNLFRTAFEESWGHKGSLDYTKIIKQILDSIHCKFSIPDANCEYREIFDSIWEKIVRHSRKSVDVSSVLHKLWVKEDITSLNFIINGPQVERERALHINEIMRFFTYDAYPLEKDFFKEFVSKVLVSEKEREIFRKNTARLRREQLFLSSLLIRPYSCS